jgi:hypothetical protein
MSARNPYLGWKVFAGLAALAALPYLRSLGLPPLSDDHLQVLLARQYGPVSGWLALAHDALYRSRATSLLLTHWTELAAGLSPLAFHVTSLALHIVNTWLVLLLGCWSPVGWRTAAIGAAFFAVYEGHQEAVIWYAALPELLVFTFGMISFLCWTAWIESGMARRRWLAAALAAFVLALYSKESGVAVAALLALPIAARGLRRKALLAAVPFGAVAAAYFATIYLARSGHQHFHDGTFVLDAPVWRTVAFSTARLFWFWGLLAAATLMLFRNRERLRLLALAMAWIAIAFLPYSFLTYMNFVPSRHTYLASAGLALVVGAGFAAFADRLYARRWLVGTVAVVAVLYNAGYVWVKKHQQYLERAAPIEAVVRAARAANGPVLVHCFPYPFPAAQAAVMVAAGKPATAVRMWSGDLSAPPPEGVLCLDPSPGGHERRKGQPRDP